jgi:hypothetical protein
VAPASHPRATGHRRRCRAGLPLGYATVGLVLGLRRPANPIGWLYATSRLTWALIIPFEAWLNSLTLSNQPLAAGGGRHRGRGDLLVLGGSLAPGQLTNGPIPIDNPSGCPG